MLHAPEAREGTLEVRGEMLHVLRGGSGRPVLFLHGAGGGGVWLPFHDSLAESFEVVAPTQPGFGASPDVPAIGDMDDLVYFYLDLLDALELEQPDLIGTSLGGWLAAELAVHSPELFRRLVLLNPVGLELPEHPMGDLFGMNPAETVAAVFHDPAVAAGIFPAEPDLDFILAMYREAGSFARIAWNPYCANPKLQGRLRRITSPTLIIHGRHDGVVPLAHAEAYAAAIPDARLEVLEDSAHGPFIEQPGETARLVTDFLKES